MSNNEIDYENEVRKVYADALFWRLSTSALMGAITTPHPVKELTPKLADKIWKSIQQRNYDAKVSKEAVLHHLKQLKAEMGKAKKKGVPDSDYVVAIATCMQIIDKKIAKINSK